MDLDDGRHLRNLIMYSEDQATRMIHHDSTDEVMEDVQLWDIEFAVLGFTIIIIKPCERRSGYDTSPYHRTALAGIRLHASGTAVRALHRVKIGPLLVF